MQRAEVLKAAGEAVIDRGLNYGQPEDNFANIARMWNAHLTNRGLLKYVGGIESHDVALMMANVKQVRISCDPNHADSWIDFTGYGACGAEVAHAGAPDGGALVTDPTLRESKFGFTVGEVVNTVNEEDGVWPGTVVKFSDNHIHVAWSIGGETFAYRPEKLRHGP